MVIYELQTGDKMNSFLQGQRDCKAGIPHKSGKGEDYDYGYGFQYELEQVASHGY